MLEDLRAEIEDAQRELGASGSSTIGVNACFGVADRVLRHPGTFWMSCDAARKARLQRVLFPSGIEFSNNEYRTDTTCLLFNGLEQADGSKRRFGSATGNRTRV